MKSVRQELFEIFLIFVSCFIFVGFIYSFDSDHYSKKIEQMEIGQRAVIPHQSFSEKDPRIKIISISGTLVLIERVK